MIDKRPVIRWKDLPAKLPIGTHVLTYLFLEHIDASTWVRGIIYVFIMFMYIAEIHKAVTTVQLPVFEVDNEQADRDDN